MLLFLATLVFADCPEPPVLRDDDDRLSVLAQNLKFIVTGGQRPERAALLGRYADAAALDLLLLSEARDVGALSGSMPDWCFYVQTGPAPSSADELDYTWTVDATRRSPGGLVLGVRRREEGTPRLITGSAGRPFRARPVSLAEGWLGRMIGFVKGWAQVEVDGTRLVWTHTQSSYDAHPERGAGRTGEGRAGQFADLAEDLGRPDHPVLLTGDLNVLDGFVPPQDDPRLRRARLVDALTLARFRARTGIQFSHPSCEQGSFLGTLRPRQESGRYVGAIFDRVGFNDAFTARHPEVDVQCVEISGEKIRLSDHRGLLITVPG